MDSNSLLKSIKTRVERTLSQGPPIDLSTLKCNHYLRRHVNNKTKLVVLCVDLVGSTKLSLSLSPQELISIINIFSTEMSIIISGHGGYILKYIGDAVIAIFPAEFDSGKACFNALYSAKTMVRIINQVINPVLCNKLPQIKVKIGIDLGESMVVLYGKNLDTSHIDLIGSGISIAAKITALAKPNQILISENVFENIVNVSKDTNFQKLDIVDEGWNYINTKTSKILNVYVVLK
ncbi:MAG TPA: adenylate/guanylate cyclase domain-containing protein [Nitrososphaeraceae archaeon]|nr:adenylate/guanylate cyclase domain-containing protein [Nitrososphaeraceae archaeon]